jgi:threonine synthase
VADGITTVNPVHGVDILKAIRESGGAAVRVDDDAILAAQKSLASRGLMVEPTSATVVAALEEVRRYVGETSRIALPLTGSGLKTLN